MRPLLARLVAAALPARRPRRFHALAFAHHEQRRLNGSREECCHGRAGMNRGFTRR